MAVLLENVLMRVDRLERQLELQNMSRLGLDQQTPGITPGLRPGLPPGLPQRLPPGVIRTDNQKQVNGEINKPHLNPPPGNVNNPPQPDIQPPPDVINPQQQNQNVPDKLTAKGNSFSSIGLYQDPSNIMGVSFQDLVLSLTPSAS
jgi:hypothetical protein